jgi:hypothetical protein
VNWRLPETGIALLIAFGFACAGELLLGRRSRSVFGWNESFLVGAGFFAAILFPLSIVLGQRALVCVLVLFVVAVVFLLASRAGGPTSRRGVSEPEDCEDGRAGELPRHEEADRAQSLLRSPASVTLFLLILASALLFWFFNLHVAFAWDGFQTWATKGFLLFHRGALSPEMWAGSLEEGRSGRAVNYPPLVPLFEALTALVRGRFDFPGVKPVFLVFYLSTLLSVFRAIRAVASRQLALAATAFTMLLPTFISRQSTGGNADLPEAACVAAVVAAWLCAGEDSRGWRSPLPWLLGTCVLIKSEGAILVVVALAAGLLVAPRRRPSAGGIVVVLAFIALRMLYRLWTIIPDPTYGPVNLENTARAISRLSLVGRLCLSELASFAQWGLFWPAFALAAAALIWRGDAKLRALALASLLGLLAYTAIFLYSNWAAGLQIHIAQAYRRLLTQLVPAAAACLAAGYATLLTPPRGAGNASKEKPAGAAASG